MSNEATININLKELREQTQEPLAVVAKGVSEYLKDNEKEVNVSTLASWEDIDRGISLKHYMVKGILKYYNEKHNANLTYEDIYDKNLLAEGYSLPINKKPSRNKSDHSQNEGIWLSQEKVNEIIENNTRLIKLLERLTPNSE